MARIEGLPHQLESLRRRFEAWRKTRKKPGRIPQKLWDSAARLARSHGPGRVAQALRLDYYDLKRRTLVSESARATPAEPTFVQIEAGGSSWEENCLVEIENGTGQKMTVRLSGGSCRELVGLAEAFLRRHP